MARRYRWFAVLFAAFVAAVPRPSSAQLSSDAARCQERIGTAGRSLKASQLAALRRCLNDAATGSCNVAARDAALAQARTRFVDAVRKACGETVPFAGRPAGLGLPKSCALQPPKGEAEAQCAALPVSDTASLASCFACWKSAEVAQVVRTLYPCKPGLVPPAAGADCAETGTPACPTGKSELRCQRRLGRAGSTLFLARTSAIEECLDRVHEGRSTGPCPDAVAQARIARAIDRFAKSVAKCRDFPPFAAFCPEDVVTPCGPGACSWPITDPDALQACLVRTTAERAEDTVCQQYADAGEHGVPCEAQVAAPCCGDGIVGGTEQCDKPGEAVCFDGPGVTILCAADCTCPTCPNGQKDAGEACDASSPVPADRTCPLNAPCGADCSCPPCGNGQKDAGESCDPTAAGNPADLFCPDGSFCPNDCRCTCGNTVVDAGEVCDPTAPGGNVACPGGTPCTNTCDCTCGNNVKDGTEDCDPGAPGADGQCSNGTACPTDCRCYVCGNGRIDPNEQCDPTDLNNNPCPDRACIAVGQPDECTCSCLNGRLDANEPCDRTAAGAETCADGKQCEDDCSCTCGNGETEPDEECDPLAPNVCPDGGPCQANCRCPASTTTTSVASSSTTITTTTVTTTTLPGCSFAEYPACAGQCPPGETCTAIRAIPGGFDLCACTGPTTTTAPSTSTTTTTTIPVCGDLVVSLDEECDDGNSEACDGCSPGCRFEYCGDGVPCPPEECDDGGTEPGDGCSPICLIERTPSSTTTTTTLAFCGDGFLSGEEQCDDANELACDGCSSCRVEYCGDGLICTPEECDDANGAFGDGCTPGCQYEVCGNGVLDAGEECDDGNTAPEDGCSGACTLEAIVRDPDVGGTPTRR